VIKYKLLNQKKKNTFYIFYIYFNTFYIIYGIYEIHFIYTVCVCVCFVPISTDKHNLKFVPWFFHFPVRFHQHSGQTATRRTLWKKTHINTYISYGEISWRVSDNKQHLVALWAPRALNITLPAVQHSKKKKKRKNTKQMRVGPGRAFKLILSFVAWRHFVQHVSGVLDPAGHASLSSLQEQAHTERKLSRFTHNSKFKHPPALLAFSIKYLSTDFPRFVTL